MHFQNCRSREFCIGEYFGNNKSFVFYSGLILKHAKCKTNERTSNVLETNYYTPTTHTHLNTHTHKIYTQVWSLQVKMPY